MLDAGEPRTRLVTPRTYEEWLELFAAHGGTDHEYLRAHLDRFTATETLVRADWPRSRGERVLDVGAHWLHQSLLYAFAGFQVTAADLPLTLDRDAVRSVAAAHGIRLHVYRDLGGGEAFGGLADDSFDLILFTEILEHITFNPVAMWRELYRVLAPGGRVVLTTPNCYWKRGRLWSPRRFLSGMGTGITVREILTDCTYGHHWKEYSGRELRAYFAALSPDFRIARLLHSDLGPEPRRGVRGAVARRLPFLFARHLYAEVDLPRKAHGIAVRAAT